MQDRPPDCAAYQASDQMLCPRCGLAWDTNDPAPPGCLPRKAEDATPLLAVVRQEGSSHYLGMPIQPFEFGMKNGWDFGACSILKYLARHRLKGGAEDLRKALYFVELRCEFLIFALKPRTLIRMEQFITRNAVHQDDRSALNWLEAWVHDRINEGPLKFSIQNLMLEYDGQQRLAL